MPVRPSSATPQQAIAALLDRYTPARLLLIGTRLPAVDAYLAAHPDCHLARCDAGALPDELAAQRFDLALVIDCLEHLPKPVAMRLLGGVRNLNASRLAVLVDLAACDWSETDFYALALQAGERFERDGQVLTLFTYDLLAYKQAPDWLNARFWANPENFGKYWW